MKNQRIFPLIVIIAGMFLLSSTFTNDSLRAVEVGAQAPDFTLKTHDDKALTLSKLHGKRGAVLVFFATWCPPCMAEVPHVKEFVEKTKEEKILVYGINLKQSERVVKDFIADKKVNYYVLMDKDGEAAKKYGVRGIPYIVGVDGAGKVIFAGHGLPRDHGDFVKKLTAPLSGSKDKSESSEKKVGEDGEVSIVDRDTLKKWKAEKEDIIIIDVLSPESYKSGHIAGAINIPLKDIATAKDVCDKDALIVTYCANFQCKASTRAAEKLMELGFTNVHDYEGGKKDWQEGGLEMAKGE